jgi:hypothetical protein
VDDQVQDVITIYDGENELVYLPQIQSTDETKTQSRQKLKQMCDLLLNTSSRQKLKQMCDLLLNTSPTHDFGDEGSQTRR